MGVEATLERACALLREHDDILILAHQDPDGDTLGSCFALWFGLRKLGKRCRVECNDAFPARYRYMFPDYKPEVFAPRFVVAADIADAQLLGERLSGYGQKVDLCVDHHPSNTFYARETYLRAHAAATAEMMYDVIDGLGVEMNREIATCLYTGISTDTGCFRFPSTSANTHYVAARMIELGADSADINRMMFSRKTQSRIAVERGVYNTIEYHCGGRCALICLSRTLMEQTGAEESELDGVSGIPCQIEGVEVGVTLREREDGFKISVRTSRYVDASALCAKLGGGGHARASGCFVAGTRAEVSAKILALVARALEEDLPEPQEGI